MSKTSPVKPSSPVMMGIYVVLGLLLVARGVEVTVAMLQVGAFGWQALLQIAVGCWLLYRAYSGWRANREAAAAGTFPVAPAPSPPPAQPEPPPVNGVAAVVGQTDFERELFSVRVEMPRSELESRLTGSTAWKWDEGNQALSGRPTELEGWQVAYEFTAKGLRAVRLQRFFAGPYERLVELDAAMRQLLPSFELHEASKPWSVEDARARLEGKGNDKMKAGVMFTAQVPARGGLVGKALAFKLRDTQHYGFELTWLPGHTLA